MKNDKLTNDQCLNAIRVYRGLHRRRILMSLVRYTDAGGDSIRFLQVDGVDYPYVEGVDQERNIRAARDALGRDDDILLVAYFKSGTHWLWEVLSMLIAGNADTVQGIKQYNMLEAVTHERLASMPSPRVLNTHAFFDDLPKDMINRKCKIVLLVRNPKDIAVSGYNHHYGLTGSYDYHGKWENYLPLFLEGKVESGRWFNYVKHYEKVKADHPGLPIHTVFYEDMKEDSRREVRKLAEFLELPLSVTLCDDIADKCTFQNMKKDKKGLESERGRGLEELVHGRPE
ncbi:ST1B1-like protein [Mya arenaria]|uniref:ST1B1-like protein n=1 Tax=Mya arenaria TaxID=6604 RepID=A0ABY7DWW4_MYAAR|nr:ST1B1-like protein [Mya arenaria]